MDIKQMRKFFAVLVAIPFALTVSQANSGPLWEFDSAGNSFSNGSWDFATSFSIESEVTVSGLGWYADPVTGNADDNPVSLFECLLADCSTTGILLASVIVDNTYALFDNFRYVDIAPLVLESGKSYQVVGVSTSNNYTWNNPGFSVDPSISLIQTGVQVARWEADTDGIPTFLNLGDTDIPGQDGFWGPNVFIGDSSEFTDPDPTSVPVPATLALFGLGLAGLGYSRRKKA